MKRIISILLATALLLACIPFTAAAASRVTFSVDNYVDATGATAGDTFSVAVRMTDCPGITNSKVWVTYDATALELVNKQKGNFQNAKFSGITFSVTSAGIVELYWESAPLGLTGDFVLATLDFKLKDAQQPCVTTLRVDYNDNANWIASAARNAILENGTVCIGVPLPGDVDGDAKLTLTDAARLQRYLADWDEDVDFIAADVQGDASLNNRDLVMLQRKLAGWEDVTLDSSTVDLPAALSITLPEVGLDVDVAKKKGRILVKDAYILGNTVFLHLRNSHKVYITEEQNYINYTCYNSAGAAIGSAKKLYIGAIDTKKKSQCMYVLTDVPAGTAEIRVTGSSITYWTEWA